MKTRTLARDARSAGFSGAEPQGIPMEVMEISPAAQAEMLLVSAVVGAVAGVVFDLLRVFRTAEFCHDILGKIYEDGTRPASTGNVKGLFDDPPQVFSLSDRHAIFGNTSGNSYDIHFLKGVISN